MQELIFTNNVAGAIDSLVADAGAKRVFVLADSNTIELVVPRLAAESAIVAEAPVIVIPAGDDNKNLDSLSLIWQNLVEKGATRDSLMLNIGGGMVTDIGGFAASTFKRGIRFINVPTTLLGAVDAAVGGKTGINFHGLKNEIGVFSQASAVVISTALFDTLPHTELLSGYAEMLKHGLLESRKAYSELVTYNISVADPDSLLTLLQQSVEVKRRVVIEDPREQGIRRALNLGHTVGHAFESLAMARKAPVPHGYAVAWGLVTELVLSHLREGFPTDILHSTAAFVKENYGMPAVTCDDYPALIDLMRHDKKNPSPDRINFTLLRTPGDIVIDCFASPEEITTALDIFRDLVEC